MQPGFLLVVVVVVVVFLPHVTHTPAWYPASKPQ